MNCHKDLDVWKKAIDFSVALYNLTSSFPDEERYGLVSQMRRAAVSISSNIAEGAARQSEKEFVQFLYVSMGSAAEIETQLIIAERLGFVKKDNQLFTDIDSLQKMLSGLIRYVKKRG